MWHNVSSFDLFEYKITMEKKLKLIKQRNACIKKISQGDYKQFLIRKKMIKI